MSGHAVDDEPDQASGEVPGRRVARLVSRLGLTPRLLLINLLIVASGAVTVLVAALLLAPTLFHQHLQLAHLPQIDSGVRAHIDHAFDQALLLALGIGVTVAALVAAAISWLIARRVAAPVQQTTFALQRLADGHHDVHVRDPGLGPELAVLADASNRLAHRLEATDEQRRLLTADLAHQLRTPIASLQATAQALQDGILAPDVETLSVLTDQSAHLQRLVDDLEKVSRAEERRIVLTSAPEDLAPIIERAVAAERERYAAHDVTLTTDLGRAGPVARVDRDRLLEVLANLLDNALRHTPAGGSVTVNLRGGTRAEPARITVADTGSGFDPAHAELLFHRFHRESGETPGSGLGLTIARALVEAHGGALTAASDGPGRGSTFTITLPRN
jgi:signal transduction histidine kinase